MVTLIFASQLQWIFVFEFAFVFSGFVGGAAAFCLARFRLFDVDYIGKRGTIVLYVCSKFVSS